MTCEIVILEQVMADSYEIGSSVHRLADVCLVHAAVDFAVSDFSFRPFEGWPKRAWPGPSGPIFLDPIPRP